MRLKTEMKNILNLQDKKILKVKCSLPFLLFYNCGLGLNSVYSTLYTCLGLQQCGMKALRTFPGFQDFIQSCRNPQIFYNFLLRLFRPGFLVIVFEGKILKNVDINILWYHCFKMLELSERLLWLTTTITILKTVKKC